MEQHIDIPIPPCTTNTSTLPTPWYIPAAPLFNSHLHPMEWSSRQGHKKTGASMNYFREVFAFTDIDVTFLKGLRAFLSLENIRKEQVYFKLEEESEEAVIVGVNTITRKREAWYIYLRILMLVIGFAMEHPAGAGKGMELAAAADTFATMIIDKDSRFEQNISEHSPTYSWVEKHKRNCYQLCVKIFLGVHPEVTAWVWHRLMVLTQEIMKKGDNRSAKKAVGPTDNSTEAAIIERRSKTSTIADMTPTTNSVPNRFPSTVVQRPRLPLAPIEASNIKREATRNIATGNNPINNNRNDHNLLSPLPDPCHSFSPAFKLRIILFRNLPFVKKMIVTTYPVPFSTLAEQITQNLPALELVSTSPFFRMAVLKEGAKLMVPLPGPWGNLRSGMGADVEEVIDGDDNWKEFVEQGLEMVGAVKLIVAVRVG